MDKDIIGRTVLFYKKLESDWCQKDRDIIRLLLKGHFFFIRNKNRTGVKRTET